MNKQITSNQSIGIFSTRGIAYLGLLSGVSIVLMYLEIPYPLASFLKLDFSDVPALIGGFIMGPFAAIIIEFIKNIVHFIIKNDGTGGVGNLANLIVGCALSVPAAMIYMKKKNIKRALIGLVVGIIAMVVAAALANYYILLPLYGMSDAGEMKAMVISVLTPFNAIKGTLVAIITFILYKPLSKILHR